MSTTGQRFGIVVGVLVGAAALTAVGFSIWQRLHPYLHDNGHFAPRPDQAMYMREVRSRNLEDIEHIAGKRPWRQPQAGSRTPGTPGSMPMGVAPGPADGGARWHDDGYQGEDGYQKNSYYSHASGGGQARGQENQYHG